MRLYQRLKRQILSQVKLVRIGLGIALGALLITLWILVLGPLTSKAWELWKSVQSGLPAASGRTNILILGREGLGADRGGGLLTDTMILVSVHQPEPDTVLLSIPRDVWVPSLKAKINSAYYYGNLKKPGSGGIILAKAAVDEIIGQPVHYALVIDFAGFEKIIDMLGGVDITVDKSFVDHKFPIAGKEDDECDGDPEFLCRYEIIQFNEGRQHMDGATALKFVRSRQAEGGEGSDFARSRRQEKLLLALRGKLLSASVLTNVKLLRSVMTQASQIVVTDIPSDLYPALVKLAWKSLKTAPRAVTLSEPNELYHPPVSAAHGGQWVLLTTDSLGPYVKNLLTVPVQN